MPRLHKFTEMQRKNIHLKNLKREFPTNQWTNQTKQRNALKARSLESESELLVVLAVESELMSPCANDGIRPKPNKHNQDLSSFSCNFVKAWNDYINIINRMKSEGSPTTSWVGQLGMLLWTSNNRVAPVLAAIASRRPSRVYEKGNGPTIFQVALKGSWAWGWTNIKSTIGASTRYGCTRKKLPSFQRKERCSSKIDFSLKPIPLKSPSLLLYYNYKNPFLHVLIK